MDRNDIIARLKHVEALVRPFGVAGLSLFGSAARNEAGPRSDIDVFVDPAGPEFYDLPNYMGPLHVLQDAFPGVEIGYSTCSGLSQHLRAGIERDAIRIF